MKERELEIGYPTDVKHVAHIGWDGSTGTAPSWVSFFPFYKNHEFNLELNLISLNADG